MPQPPDARELLLLRHGKSAWDSAAATDFERPLAGRGRRDAPRMGRWLKHHGLVPDRILSSPALRAQETAVLVAEVLALPDTRVAFDRRLYEADGATLGAVLAPWPHATRRLLLVGHNPGLDELLERLCGRDLPRTPKGKLLTTAALARVRVTGEGMAPGGGTLIALVRPRDLA